MGATEQDGFPLVTVPHTAGVPGSVGRLDKQHGLYAWIAMGAASPGFFIGLGGINTPQSALHINGALQEPFATKTAAYTITAYDSMIAADTTSGAYNITLPSAIGCAGRAYTIKRITATANTPTVNCTGGQTIDGAATYALSAQWKFVSVISTGAAWLICGNN